MVKTKALVKQNNERRKLLNEENKDYLLKSEAFQQNLKNKKMFWSWALASGLFILAVLIFSMWVEPFGLTVEVSKYTQLIAGIVLILVAYGLQKWREAQ